jgi:DNA-directed RNA polymerase specialized sigma24 family protein
LHTYDIGQSFRTWLYTCVQNVISDFLRAERRAQHEAIDVHNPRPTTGSRTS